MLHSFDCVLHRSWSAYSCMPMCSWKFEYSTSAILLAAVYLFALKLTLYQQSLIAHLVPMLRQLCFFHNVTSKAVAFVRYMILSAVKPDLEMIKNP